MIQTRIRALIVFYDNTNSSRSDVEPQKEELPEASSLSSQMRDLTWLGYESNQDSDLIYFSSSSLNQTTCSTFSSSLNASRVVINKPYWLVRADKSLSWNNDFFLIRRKLRLAKFFGAPFPWNNESSKLLTLWSCVLQQVVPFPNRLNCHYCTRP